MLVATVVDVIVVVVFSVVWGLVVVVLVTLVLVFCWSLCACRDPDGPNKFLKKLPIFENALGLFCLVVVVVVPAAAAAAAGATWTLVTGCGPCAVWADVVVVYASAETWSLPVVIAVATVGVDTTVVLVLLLVVVGATTTTSSTLGGGVVDVDATVCLALSTALLAVSN